MYTTPIFTFLHPTTFAAFFCSATTIFVVQPIHHAFCGVLPHSTILVPFARSCVVVDQPSRVVARPSSTCRRLRPHALRQVLRHEPLHVEVRPSSACESFLVLAQIHWGRSDYWRRSFLITNKFFGRRTAGTAIVNSIEFRGRVHERVDAQMRTGANSNAVIDRAGFFDPGK